jgi:transcriptional regulator with XRE-family HTH domain
MTKLEKLLAYNIKEKRRKMGLSQAKLAKKAGFSVSYIAAVEGCSRFPSPKNLEILAQALEMDTLELFSMPPSVEGIAKKLCRDIIVDLEQKIGERVDSAVKAAVSEVVAAHLKGMGEQERPHPRKKKPPSRSTAVKGK